jgi:hypothetical protein
MADLDELALAMPQTTKEVSDDGRPAYLVHGKLKDLFLADDRGLFFTTPHFDGYPAVLVRIPDLARVDREELFDLVAEAWLARAQERVANPWLQEHGARDD